MPENTYGAELVFFNSNFKVKDFRINNLKNSSFHFAVSDTDKNLISFVIADKSGLDYPLTFSLVNKSLEKLTTSLKYKFIDNKSVQINKGIGNIDLEILVLVNSR